jgi:mRNA interferase RelE/StbE
VTYRVEYAERVSLMLGRFMDDPQGLSEALAACDRLAEDPFPADSVPYGKSHRRLHIGVYRATYEIGDDMIIVINMARV